MMTRKDLYSSWMFLAALIVLVTLASQFSGPN